MTATNLIPVRDATEKICAEECKAQCCRAPGFFSLTGEELGRLHLLAIALGVEFRVYADPDDPDWFTADHKTNGGSCSFLDTATSRCRIYSSRPDACRGYPYKPEPRCRLWYEAP